jgi:hypothetical protein
MALCMLFSTNLFTKVAKLMTFLNTPLFSRSTYISYCRQIAGTVERFYLEVQDEIFVQLNERGEPVILIGDGQVTLPPL